MMNKQFIQLTSGWIPVVVMVLLTIALVAGQARANLPNEFKAAPVLPARSSVSILLTSETRKKLESLPALIDTLMALPVDIELRFDANALATGVSNDPVFRGKAR